MLTNNIERGKPLSTRRTCLRTTVLKTIEFLRMLTRGVLVLTLPGSPIEQAATFVILGTPTPTLLPRASMSWASNGGFRRTTHPEP
jgi:hypothetical protein